MDPEQPPAYDSYNNAPENAETPPTYSSAQEQAGPSLELKEELPTLVLDRYSIYSRLNPNQPLYELSNAPCEASTSMYGIEKIRYKVRMENGETKSRCLRDHIYDFKSDYLSWAMRDITITGRARSRRVFPIVTMSRGLGTSSFTVAGHFKTEQRVKNRVQNGSEITWKDTSGKVIAVETKVERSKDGKLVEMPRLEIKCALDESTLDLLVTCWCARLWKQAKSELTETWDHIRGIKRRIENHPSMGAGMYY